MDFFQRDACLVAGPYRPSVGGAEVYRRAVGANWVAGHVARGTDSEDQPGPAPSTQRQSILVADDDRLIVATLGRGLAKAGFEVIEAFDSASALEGCVQYAPSLAIIDYKMPGLTGIDLAGSITSRTNVPVIFLSAYSDEPIVRAALGAGAMVYLVKPVDVQQLIPVVHGALEMAAKMQVLRDEIKATQKRNRVVNIATGLLMARFQIGEREAFGRLRRHARSTRTRLEEVAEALLRATEETSQLYEKLRHSGPGSAVGPESEET